MSKSNKSGQKTKSSAANSVPAESIDTSKAPDSEPTSLRPDPKDVAVNQHPQGVVNGHSGDVGHGDVQPETPFKGDPIDSDRSTAWITATRKRRQVIETFCMNYVHRAEFIPRYGEVAARTWPISRSEFVHPDIISPEQRRDLVEWIHLVAHFTTQLHHLGKLGSAGRVLAAQLRDEPHRASELEQEEAMAMEAYEALESSFFSLIACTRYPRN